MGQPPSPPPAKHPTSAATSRGHYFYKYFPSRDGNRGAHLGSRKMRRACLVVASELACWALFAGGWMSAGEGKRGQEGGRADLARDPLALHHRLEGLPTGRGALQMRPLLRKRNMVCKRGDDGVCGHCDMWISAFTPLYIGRNQSGRWAPIIRMTTGTGPLHLEAKLGVGRLGSSSSPCPCPPYSEQGPLKWPEHGV